MTHATKALTSLIINDIIGLRNEDATFDKVMCSITTKR